MATRYQFVDDSGETRLAGLLVPEPGGSLPSGWTTDATTLKSNGGQLDLLGEGGVSFDWGDFGGDNPGQGSEWAMPGTDMPAVRTWDEGFNHAVFELYGHTAPSDGAITAGVCGVWFDQTDGAAKVRFKARSADGTLVTGAVNLA